VHNSTEYFAGMLCARVCAGPCGRSLPNGAFIAAERRNYENREQPDRRFVGVCKDCSANARGQADRQRETGRRGALPGSPAVAQVAKRTRRCSGPWMGVEAISCYR
jgi:hypothetical protein